MTDDVDLAMQLSASRIQLRKTEERLFALLYEIFAFTSASEKLVYGILNKDESEVAENLTKIAEWSIDIEINILLNLLYPTTLTTFIAPGTPITAGSQPRLMEQALETLQEIGAKHSARCIEQWNALAIPLNGGTRGQRLLHMKEKIGALAKERLNEIQKSKAH